MDGGNLGERRGNTPVFHGKEEVIGSSPIAGSTANAFRERISGRRFCLRSGAGRPGSAPAPFPAPTRRPFRPRCTNFRVGRRRREKEFVKLNSILKHSMTAGAAGAGPGAGRATGRPAHIKATRPQWSVREDAAGGIVRCPGRMRPTPIGRQGFGPGRRKSGAGSRSTGGRSGP